MPQCDCFHSYQLKRLSVGEYELKLPSGEHGRLREALENSRLVTSFFSSVSHTTTFTLHGVRREYALASFLNLLKNKIIVDLSPLLDECYALGPYTVFEDGQGSASVWGSLVNHAKYRRDQSAQAQILAGIEDFIDRHPVIRTVDSVVSPPKSDRNTPDLVGSWAQAIVNKRGWQRPIANKVQTTTRA